MAQYVCPVCGFTYDEGEEGAAWSALPEDWVCPVCGAEKSSFESEDGGPVADESTVSPERSDVERGAGPVAKNTAIEPTLEFIHALARDGLAKTGHQDRKSVV